MSPMRRACDRCHRSKQKCIRLHDDSGQSCRRCLDAGLGCVYSPPTTRSNNRGVEGAGPAAAAARDGSAAQAVMHAAASPDPRMHVHAPSDSASVVADAGEDTRLDLSDDSRLRVLGATDMAALLSDPRADTEMDLDEWALPDEHAVDSSSGPHQRSRSSLPSFLSGEPATEPPTSSLTTSNTASNNVTCTSWPVSASTTISNPGFSAFTYEAGQQASATEDPSPVTLDREEPEPSRPSGLAEWTRKLADLNCQLTQHLACVPELDNDGEAVPTQCPGGSPSAQAQVVAIDTTFHLSQLFIDTLSQLRQEIPPAQRHMTTPTATKKPDFSLDESSELLVFSAYLRLLEIYSRVIHHMQTYCAAGRRTEAAPHTFSLPNLTIGSFSLSLDSTTQFTLLINLMESMLARARDLVSEIASPKNIPGYRGNFHCFGGVSLVIVPDLALQAIRAREHVVLNSAKQMKLLLLRT
ncbi:hypothetical protein Daus18300_014474 [Diaporthe australafricana]|uniref:Zn(2)-C6 fungal-type domain-containing protein n=1 Tax=Diaporthe australafricana TaxID=127596 RepID=A0ABR3VV30_9PEZI